MFGQGLRLRPLFLLPAGRKTGFRHTLRNVPDFLCIFSAQRNQGAAYEIGRHGIPAAAKDAGYMLLEGKTQGVQPVRHIWVADDPDHLAVSPGLSSFKG